MNKKTIPYQETGYFSKLMSDYLEEKEQLKPFYNHYCDIDSFVTIIEERRQNPINRTILVEVLIQQYDNVETSEKTKTNIKNLSNENCFTVTTGHQLNLFTGPLYFIYKIVSAINLTKELKAKYPNNDFVPVYWMATEDHDFEEINHFNLLNKRYELTKTQTGAVGRMKLEGVEELLSELRADLGDRNGVEEIMTLFSKYCVSSNTYGEAIKGIVNHLFGRYGLVIIDGDNAELKRVFTNEIKQRF
ncbi:MAG: bacillithiol biosynthesis BshC [Flavobacteriales bacterium]|nr:bacillithiol biosynthesis BshC [Flavobacteriales bacterium]